MKKYKKAFRKAHRESTRSCSKKAREQISRKAFVIQANLKMSKSMNAIPNELQQIWNDDLEAKKACREWASNHNVWLSTTHSSINGDKRKVRFACKHYGEPRNQDVYDNNTTPVTVKTFTASNDGKVSETLDKNIKHCNKDSQRIGCPFSLTLRPLSKDSHQWRVVSFYNGGHNHELALENRRIWGFVILETITMLFRV